MVIATGVAIARVGEITTSNRRKLIAAALLVITTTTTITPRQWRRSASPALLWLGSATSSGFEPLPRVEEGGSNRSARVGMKCHDEAKLCEIPWTIRIAINGCDVIQASLLKIWLWLENWLLQTLKQPSTLCLLKALAMLCLTRKAHHWMVDDKIPEAEAGRIEEILKISSHLSEVSIFTCRYLSRYGTLPVSKILHLKSNNPPRKKTGAMPHHRMPSPPFFELAHLGIQTSRNGRMIWWLDWKDEWGFQKGGWRRFVFWDFDDDIWLVSPKLF